MRVKFYKGVLMWRRNIIAASVLILSAASVHAQDDLNHKHDGLKNIWDKHIEKKKEKDKEVPHKGSYYITPLPAFGQNPSWGTMYGAVVSASWFMGEPETTKISTLQVLGLLTTKDQTMITTKGTMYTEDNEYKVDIDGRYLDTSQPTYGLGSGPLDIKPNAAQFDEDGQLMLYNFYRAYLTLSKQVGEDFYLGVGYHYDTFTNVVDDSLDLPSKETSYYTYNERYGFDQESTVLSGVSLNASYDTRDNINSTYKGHYALASYRYNPEFLGSDQSSSTLWLEYRDYFDLTGDHRNMLAIWLFGNFTTSGKLPYMDLPSIGYDQFSNSGRGYEQGRIRGEHLVYAEVEYRVKLMGRKDNPDFFGMVFFANATTAQNEDDNIMLFDEIDPSVGAGFRFMLDKTSRTMLEIDYAVGRYGSSGFYIGLNESF